MLDADAVLINDGQNRTATIQNVVPTVGPLKILFRHALSEDMLEYHARGGLYGNGSGKAGMDNLERLLIKQKRLLGWSLRDKEGESIPITRENLNRLHSSIAGKIVDLISGWEKSEVDGLTAVQEQEKN